LQHVGKLPLVDLPLQEWSPPVTWRRLGRFFPFILVLESERCRCSARCSAFAAAAAACRSFCTSFGSLLTCGQATPHV